MFRNAQRNSSTLWRKMGKVEKLANYLEQGCGDEYTVFPKELYSHYYKQMYITFILFILTILLSLLVIANLIVT